MIRRHLCGYRAIDCCSGDNDGVIGSVRPLDIPTPRGEWMRDRNAFASQHVHFDFFCFVAI